MRLFIDRAMASLPTFTVTDRNASILAQVCCRLDGIPLAIELAAARVRVLSLEQIAERLNDWFRLLTGGSRTAGSRQQTLLSTMEWSHGLLSGHEQILFRRLSVFAGGFTLEATETVCTGDGVELHQMLDLLTQLADKSLVQVEGDSSAVRYRLLETVRQYGQRKLEEAGEVANTRTRHRNFFLALAEHAEPELRGQKQPLWLHRLEQEHDNLRAAIEWSLENEQVEPGLRLVGALWRFWSVRGYNREGRAWSEQVLRRSGEASPAFRAKALSGAGLLATNQADYAIARPLLEESLAIRRQLGDKLGIATMLNVLGTGAFHQGDFERAAALYNEGLAIAMELGAKDTIGVLLNNLGTVALSQSDDAAARSLFEESLTLRRQLGDKLGIAMSAGNLAIVAFRQGEHAAARVLLEESLAIDRDLGDKRGSAGELEIFGLLAAAQGDAGRSARLLGAAEVLREAIGAPLTPVERAMWDYERHVAAVRAALGREGLAAAWNEGRAMTYEQAVEHALQKDP